MGKQVSFGEFDKANNEIVSVGAIPDSSGNATIQYWSFLNGITVPTAVVNDQITPFACGMVWPCPAEDPTCGNVYNFYPFLTGSTTQRMDVGVSQVNDATFTNSNAPINIQTFLNNIPSGKSFLALFYFVDTAGDHTYPNGFVDVDGDGLYTPGVDAIYCSDYTTTNQDTTCIEPSVKGTFVAAGVILGDAINNKVNPEVILATLQKESSLITTPVLQANLYPISDDANLIAKFTAKMNNAMGVGTKNLFSALQKGAHALRRDYAMLSEGHHSGTMPYFFPVDPDSVGNSIQYPYTVTANCFGKNSLQPGCDTVGFWIANAATEAQYHYTPFVETTEKKSGGGGVFGFETAWYMFNSAGWYQQGHS